MRPNSAPPSGVWVAAALTSAQVGRVPVPPVMFGMRFFIRVVVLRRFAEKFCKRRDVNASCSLLLPFAARKARLDFLEQVTVPVRILERRKRKIETTVSIATPDTRGFPSVV